MIRMHMNESPYDFPFRAKVRMLFRALITPWNRYPEAMTEKALEALSSFTGKKKENLLLGNGSNELIRLSFLTWGGAGKKIVWASPTFVTYEKEARRSGCCPLAVPLDEDLDFDFGTFSEAAEKADMVVLISPGNPSGKQLAIKKIEEIVKHCPGMVIVDEAYGEFAGQTAMDLIEKYRNLIILRTFSKAFGLAGGRIGYAVGSQRIIEDLKKASLPYNPGIFPLLLLQEAIKEKRVPGKRVKKICNERARLLVSLKKMPFVDVCPGEGNFFLMRGKSREANTVIFNVLQEKKILPRVYREEGAIVRLRITVGRPWENRRFLKAMETVQRRLS